MPDGEVAEQSPRRAIPLALPMPSAIAHGRNKLLHRGVSVGADRYFARALATPREVRNAIRYVLLNRRKHAPQATGLGPCSSGEWFTGWSVAVRRSPGPPPTRPPRTWLAAIGRRRHGPIDPGDVPDRLAP